MIHFPGTNWLSFLEPGLLAVTWCLCVRKKAYKRFPAFGVFLTCRMGVLLALSVILTMTNSGWVSVPLAHTVYHYVYWIGYLAGAAVMFLVIQTIFSHVIEPFPGLRRVGLIGFRFATMTAVLVAIVTAVFPVGANHDLLVLLAGGVMRCMSILKLCLFAFILLSRQALQLSPKSREFGISLGMAMIAMAELGGSAFASTQSTTASVASYLSQIVVIVAVGIWVAYFTAPVVERGAVILPSSSPLLRWNEIANALAEPAPQISLGSPASSFFLQDVEKAVDRVMERNAIAEQ